MDDLLDVLGDSGEMGKTLGKDAEQGKLTMVSRYGVEGAREMVRAQCDLAVQALAGFGPEADFFRSLMLDTAERTN